MDSQPERLALDARARRAIAIFRAQAFDIIDVDALAALAPIPLETLAWIGRRLALSARTVEGFQEGRETAAAAEALIQTERDVARAPAKRVSDSPAARYCSRGR